MRLLTEKQTKYLCSVSVQRILNAAINFLEQCPPIPDDGKDREGDLMLTIDNLKDATPIIVRLWTAYHDEQFKPQEK